MPHQFEIPNALPAIQPLTFISSSFSYQTRFCVDLWSPKKMGPVPGLGYDSETQIFNFNMMLLRLL